MSQFLLGREKMRPSAAFIQSKKVVNRSFEYGLKVLEETLAIGRQADALGAVCGIGGGSAR
jgi:hypothetical protein